MTDFDNKKKENVNSETTDTKNTTQSGGINAKTDKPESKLANNVGNVVHGDTKAAKDIYKQAKDSGSETAGKIYDTAAKKATSKVDEQKANLAQGLSSVADNIRQMGESLSGEDQPHGVARMTADYSHTLADKVEQFSGYLDNKDLGEMMNDIEHFAHRNPALFLGGAFALGIVAARFLKSGNSNQALMRRSSYQREGKYLPKEREGGHLPQDLDKLTEESKKTTTANTASLNKGA